MKNILKKIGVTIILGISLFSLIGCGSSSEKTLTTDVSLSDDETSTIKLNKNNPVIVNYEDDSYSELSNMVAHNELKAEETYLNKTIKITGEVCEITTKNNKIIVVVTSPNKLGAVYLEFDNSYKDKILNLNLYDKVNKKDGDIITVYGYCSKFDNICLVLSNCEFE